ncbi:MAG: transglutaminase domain-containing protein [Eubacteriales bacterium]|nr:transglutaminase domain-containing protein [Eubacteriales bacterium]
MKEQWKRQFGAQAAQAGVFLALAYGLSWIVLRAAQTPVPWWQPLALLVALYAVLETGRRKWWLLPALGVLACGGVALALWRLPVWRAQMAVSFGQATAAFSELFSAGRVSEPTAALLLPTVLALGIAAFFLLRTRKAWPAALAALLLLGWGCSLGWRNTETGLCLCLTALGAQLGVAAYASHKEQKDQRPHAALGAACAALAAVLLTATLIPAGTSLSAWPWLRTQVEDLNDVLSNYTSLGAARPRDLFSVSKTGFGSSDGKLGGPAVQDDAFYLRVTAPSGTLLRGSIRNAYSGDAWTSTLEAGQRRFGSVYWNAQLARVYNHTVEGWQNMTLEGQAMLATPTTLTIQHLTQDTSSLFGAGRVKAVTSNVGASLIPYFDINGEMFSQYYVSRNYSYTVDTSLILTNASGFDAFMERYTARETAADTPELSEYLALPDELPDEVKTLAQSLSADSASPYGKAVALRDYLRTFTYTLTPGEVPQGQDFVAHFLETKEGYCTYYASALAVMARCVGIPSRYVEGFLVPQHTDDNPCLISGKQAHAWVELYFPGAGWIPMDATPGDSLNTQLVLPPSSQEENRYTMPPIETPAPEQSTADPVQEAPRDLSALWKGLAVLCGAILLFLPWLPWILHARSMTRRAWERAFPDPALRTEAYWANAVKVLREFESKASPGDTPFATAQRMDRWLRLPSGSLEDLAGIVVRLRYARQMPTQEELLWCHTFTRELEGLLRQFLGINAYYRQRVTKRKF